MAVPDTLDWAPGLVTVTVSLTVQVKVVLVPVKPARVGGRDGHRVGPAGGRCAGDDAAELMVRPGGAPDSGQPVRVAADEESVAVSVRVAMAVPDGGRWAPGLVTDTVLVMVQVKVAEPWAPRLSVAVRVTE